MKSRLHKLLIVLLVSGLLASGFFTSLSGTVVSAQEQETEQIDEGDNFETPFDGEDDDLEPEPPENENDAEQNNDKDGLSNDTDSATDADTDLIDDNDLGSVQDDGLQSGEEDEKDVPIAKLTEWQDILPEDVVRSEDELYQWFKSHKETGGDVYLGDHITISGYDTRYDPHYTIHTGRYGIPYDGSCISLDDFEIIGEGVDVPVVCIKDSGGRWSNWNADASTLNITAIGKDGAGGTNRLACREGRRFCI